MQIAIGWCCRCQLCSERVDAPWTEVDIKTPWLLQSAPFLRTDVRQSERRAECCTSHCIRKSVSGVLCATGRACPSPSGVDLCNNDLRTIADHSTRVRCLAVDHVWRGGLPWFGQGFLLCVLRHETRAVRRLYVWVCHSRSPVSLVYEGMLLMALVPCGMSCLHAGLRGRPSPICLCEIIAFCVLYFCELGCCVCVRAVCVSLLDPPLDGWLYAQDRLPEFDAQCQYGATRPSDDV